MQWRLLAVLGALMLSACTISPPRAPQPLPPVPTVQPLPAPVVSTPVPVVESPPSLPPVVEAPAPEPTPLPETRSVPATPTSTLLASVQSAVATGDLNRAAALCERALRISPRDAQLWYQLALIRFRQHRNDDAAGTARRALTMAGKDIVLVVQINSLLQQIQGK